MSNFLKVKTFMNKFKQEVKTKPSFPDEKIIKLRINLIKEELLELEEALNERNLEETACITSYFQYALSLIVV